MLSKEQLKELRVNLIRIRDEKLCTHITIGTLSGNLRIENDDVKRVILDAAITESIKQIDNYEKNRNA